MTGATGAPNPVCSNRELLQDNVPVQGQRTREVGREWTADLYWVTLIISLFFLLGGKTSF